MAHAMALCGLARVWDGDLRSTGDHLRQGRRAGVWDTPDQGAEMAYTRAQVREAVERAGDEHWQALIRHHEDAYPASRPTPGDICQAEAERLNQLGLDAEELTLVETRVERTDSTIRVVHVFEYGPRNARLLTEPFDGYGGDESGESEI
jgi:hypothetical protein